MIEHIAEATTLTHSCCEPHGRVELPTWDLSDRLHWLEGFARRIDVHCDDLIAVVVAETGKSAWEAFATDILPLRASIQWHLRNSRAVLASHTVGGRPWWLIGQHHRVIRVPLGRVAIIATWNYPVQLLGIQLMQSLVAGNATVVKPSENSPRSQGLLLRLAAVDLPDGYLTRTPATREAGVQLLESNGFDHVIFTGSTEVGRVIAACAAQSLTTTTLELSGCDSAVVLAGADLRLATRSLWQAVTMNAGQTCMAPRRVIVESTVYRAFLAQLAPLVAGSRPMRLISTEAAKRMDWCVEDAIARGGHSLSGVFERAIGTLVRPVAVFDCSKTSALAIGSHFSPAVAIIRAENEQEAFAIQRSFGKNLSVSVFAPSATVQRISSDSRLIESLQSGFVTFNDTIVPTAHPGVSIRGRGESGWGASRGSDGLLELTRAVTISKTSRWLRLPTGEPTARVQRTFRRLLGVTAAPTRSGGS